MWSATTCEAGEKAPKGAFCVVGDYDGNFAITPDNPDRPLGRGTASTSGLDQTHSSKQPCRKECPNRVAVLLATP